MNSFSDYIINQTAIKNNILKYKSSHENTKICAVVKADGYGIGIKYVVKAIDNLTNFYAVACFKEAIELRKLTTKKILILNYVKKNVLKKCVQNNISITVFNQKQLEDIISQNLQTKVKIHFAINTGMNRIGFSDINQFKKSVDFVYIHSNKIEIEGIFTHFFQAENSIITDKQNCIFNQFIKILSRRFDINKIIKHTSNSLASIKYSKLGYDMVRLGILIYGLVDAKQKEYQEVLSIRSRIINITKIKKNEYVSYGNSFIAKNQMKIATIPLGYADGIFRCFHKQGKVLIGGKFCKVIGTICMDMFMVDISKTDAKIGDEVVLIGKDKIGNAISANSVADWCNTISYEILTNIKKNRFNIKIEK